MKKLIAMLLILTMAVSLTACVADTTPSGTTQPKPETPSTQAPTEAPTDAPESTPPVIVLPGTGDNGPTSPAFEGDTMGAILLADFQERIAAAPDASLEELAAGLLENPVIKFMSMTMPMGEEDYLQGFDTEITGFQECVWFGPGMGSIAFAGYLFRLEDGADVDAFMQTLKDNANLRWQICVSADECIVENVGNTVFFLMAPYGMDD